jgi:hypothetical protein
LVTHRISISEPKLSDPVATLRKGVKAWNEWRATIAGAHPDFSGATIAALDWTDRDGID